MTPTIKKINMHGVTVSVVRDDLNHPVVQGNKLRKLKYNLIEAQQQQAHAVLTFGGAYSNHLVATAFAAKTTGLDSIGIVRGDELADNPAKWSHTLKESQAYGMQLYFVTRQDYRLKAHSDLVSSLIADNEHNIFIIPEGGSNRLATHGVAELVDDIYQKTDKPSHVFCPVGTGGTVAGVINGVAKHDALCQVFGVVVLKGLHGVKKEIKQWLNYGGKRVKWSLLTDYHGGGYAKSTGVLRTFAVDFTTNYDIPLDKIYNAKSFYALNDMIKQGRITTKHQPFIIHTGGLQGGTFGAKP